MSLYLQKSPERSACWLSKWESSQAHLLDIFSESLPIWKGHYHHRLLSAVELFQRAPTEQLHKNVPCADGLRFTVPLRMALIWQWSLGFEEKCSWSESLWTCAGLRLREAHGPTWAEQHSKSALWHGDITEFVACQMLAPTVVQLWHGSSVASTLSVVGSAWIDLQQMT